MGNPWIKHLMTVKKANEPLFKKDGLKAIILLAKESYHSSVNKLKKVKKSIKKTLKNKFKKSKGKSKKNRRKSRKN